MPASNRNPFFQSIKQTPPKPAVSPKPNVPAVLESVSKQQPAKKRNPKAAMLARLGTEY